MPSGGYRMAKETIRVVVCGDDGVGKSSLVISLVKGRFIPNIQHVLPPVTIPRDFSASPYSPRSTIVVDTDNSKPAELERELRTADVIWLVYSDHDSYERVSLYWMMMFRSLGLNLPVILCKNKCDDMQDALTPLPNSLAASPPPQDTKIEDEEFIPILMEFKEVDTCIKSSAKAQFDVNQAFYLCQRAITHPVSPLFDSRIGELKPLAITALKRIFLLSDRDQDGFLNDREMSSLQTKCFNKSIDVNELEFIKQALLQLPTISTKSTDYVLYEPGKGITKEGFLTLNKLYAEKGRHETIWGILRTFHYTDSLCIEDKVLYPTLNIPVTASVELSPQGYRFLVELFIRFDKDNDGGLNDKELNLLFKCAPGLPQLWSTTKFPFSTVVNNRGFITLQGWLAQWSMTTFLDYKTTTAYLVYFGFDQDAQLGIQVTKPRRLRRRNSRLYRSSITDRKVLNCYVIGKSGCGKTSLLESFLGRYFSERFAPNTQSRIAVNSLELKGGKQYYLILQEVDEQEFIYGDNANKFNDCDVICLAYDSSDPESFSYLVNLFDRHRSQLENLPLVFVALKADLDKQQQRCYLQPDDFAESLQLDHPLHVSSAWPSSLNELLIKITEVALAPNTSMPRSPMLTNPPSRDYTRMLMMASSVVGIAAIFGIAATKFWKPLRGHS